jgi:MFS transporter, OFA family, oxalate/formate antiporter
MMKDRKGHSLGIHWGWVVLGSSFVTLFVSYSIRIGAYSVLLPEMIKDLGINMTQAGMIRAAYIFAYILFSPLAGWLSDRIGGRFVISFSCLFLGLGAFMMGRATSLFTAILFNGITGAGAAAMWTPVVMLIQKWFGTTRRGLALGILSPSYALGFGLMGLVLPLIVKTYSWRMGWFLLGISGLVLIAINGLLLRNDPEEMGLLPWGESSKSISYSPRSPLSFSYREVLRGSRFWLIGTSYLFISMGAYIVSDFIVTYGVIELKMGYSAASTLMSIMALTSIAGSLVLMILSDYIGRKKSLVVTHSLLTLGVLLIILGRNNIPFVRVGIGCFGFFYGGIFPMYAACTRDYFPKEVAGTVLGIFTIFYGVGAIIGPIVAGRLTDVTGTFRWSFGLGACAALTAAMVIGFLKKPKEF